jgi:cell division protein FtsZ
LVNITGGKDLKLFEVDEAVNKVRAEVDPEAELIIGAITDSSLDGKMRVSIVATALDGQQPEAKSVINMVHRIQNRNPGYSDFSNAGPAQSFNFSNSSVATDGANALKLENEIVTESASETSSMEQIKDLNEEYNEQVLSNQENETEINIEDNIEEEKLSNGLENFAIEEESPELFNSEDDSSLQEFSSSNDNDNNSEEDDLEIPAFLRRQKN